MLKRGWNWASVCPPGPTAALLGSRGEGVPDPHPSPGASGRSRHSGENEGPYRLKSRISLLRAGVDMLPSSPAVSLKEKSPAQPPHPPAPWSLVGSDQASPSSCWPFARWCVAELLRACVGRQLAAIPVG